MIKNLNLEKAVDYLIDETPEGASVRDGADPCRLSDRQRSDRWKKRWRRALPLIVRLCAEGRWKATGKKPGSAVPEHIPNIHFNGSEINAYGDLMSTPGPMPFSLSRRPGRKVVLWTELMFSVPVGADEGKAAEMSEPAIIAGDASSVGRPTIKAEIEPAHRNLLEAGEGAERAAAMPTKAAINKMFADLHQKFLDDNSRPATVNESYKLARFISVGRDRARVLRRGLPSHLKNKRSRPSQK